MKKIFKLALLAVATPFVATSCMEDVEPTRVATQEQIEASTSALDGLVGAIPVSMTYPYSVYGSSNNFGYDFGYPGIMCSLDAATGDIITAAGDDGTGYNWFANFQQGLYMGQDGTRPKFVWDCYYNFIKSINDVIKIIVALDPEELNDTQKTYLASAKAYRALLYLDMARLYDPLENDYLTIPSSIVGLTVPIVDENTTEADTRVIPRATREEMFDFIFSNLEEAKAIFEEIEFGNRTLPTLATIYGIEARAYLWLGGVDAANSASYYSKAAAAARMAIEEVDADLMDEDTWLDKTTGFNTPNDTWMLYLPQSAEGVTNLVNFVAWRSSEATWGYGSLVQQGVTSNFYTRISNTDFRKRAFIGPTQEHEDYADISLFDLSNEDDEEYFESLKAYRSIKFRPGGGNITDYKTGNVTSIPLMRLAEMYFIEAEAKAHANPSEGLAILKEFMASRDKSYSTTATSVESVVEEIIFQKRVELWGEGILFYDFKRLNMGVETGYAGTNAPTEERFDTDGRMPWWNLCMPESNTQLNPALAATNNPDPSGLVKVWVE